MRRVVIVQRRLPHYRVPLFERLREQCAARGLELVLVHGDPTAEEAEKHDSGSLDWARHAATRYALGGRLCWQDPSRWTRDAALVIVTPENRLLWNLWLQLGPRRSRVGLWGHGANFQGRADSLRERFKRQMARRTDWWFAYTRASLGPIAQAGFPSNQVTVLNNAVDTRKLAAEFAAVRPADVLALRRRLRLAGQHVGIFVGSLYAEKRLDFLLEAARRIRAEVPDFELLVVGAGPQSAMVQAFAASHPWVHATGPLHGPDKATAMAASTLFLNPGLVGLSLLDTFVCGVPMVTTDCGLHSPEIAYLEHEVNGLSTADDVGAYADAVVRLWRAPGRLEALQAGCRAAAGEYTIERMAERFADGIEACLAQVPLAGERTT